VAKRNGVQAGLSLYEKRWLVDSITLWAGPIDTAYYRRWCGKELSDEAQRFVAIVLIPYGSPLAGDLWVGNRLIFYRGADKSLARPISRCILFDGENISFDVSLVIYIYIYK
jgi:hypothetical protein